MAELLLELLSEDIPPSMQEAAGENLERLLRAALKKQGCEVAKGTMFATSRRIGVWFIDLPRELAAQTETRRGPKISAPQQAIDGFKRSLEGVNAKITEQDGYYHAQIERPAMEMKTLLAEMIPELLKNFPWPKSMRWPQNKDGSGDFRWVRPLRSVLCILDGEVVPFSVGGVDASDKTYGHIFDAPAEITIPSLEDYQNKLREAHVLIFPDDRREKIKQQIKEKMEDLKEKMGPLKAPLEEKFIALTTKISECPTLEVSNVYFSEDKTANILGPPSKIRDSLFLKEHCLPFENPGKQTLFFIACIDGQKKDRAVITKGFSVLLRARATDAAFFLRQDFDTGIYKLREKLKDISFHPKLGSFFDKAERFKKLFLGKILHNSLSFIISDTSKEAAHYAKIDIASQTGKEFPEALGQIASELVFKGRPQGDMAAEKLAIAEHYDSVPSINSGKAFALVDRADTLAGFFSIGETPTGSKDPFALRRSALGIIRIILENERIFQKLDLNDLFAEALDLYSIQDKKPILENLRAFITERLKFYLRAQDQSADFVAAAMRAESGLNLVRIQARLRALAQFLNTKDGDHLMTAWRRLSGILKETSGGSSASGSDCANPPAADRLHGASRKKTRPSAPP